MERNLDFILEPVRFFSSPRLLSGAEPAALPAGAEIVTDLERAMVLENEQELPAGYVIWLDAFANARGAYYTRPEAREGEALVVETEEGQVSDLEELEGEVLETEFVEFWDTVVAEVVAHFEAVSVGRYVLGERSPKLLEDMFQTYRAGFYPCGLRTDGGIVAFDPKALGGFDLVAAVRGKARG